MTDRTATEQSLIDAIVANPDDDEPRLVYADLLESRGDLRGELIQLECKLPRANGDTRPAIEARIAVLLKNHRRELLADLLALKLGATFSFERGFVVEMSGHVPTATKRAAEVIEHAPLLSRFDLTIDGQRDRMQLAKPKSNALLARATSLTIRGLKTGNTRFGRGPIVELGGLAATPFTRLRRLDIVRVRAATDEIALLLRSPHLATLEYLRISTQLPAPELAEIQPAIDTLRAARPTLELTVT